MERLYSDRADLWVRLSPVEDYAAEAGVVIQTIQAHWRGEVPGGLRVLDLGAGAGHSLVHLARAAATREAPWRLTALDRSSTLLARLAETVPEAQRVLADMRNPEKELGQDRHFDVILMHDSADYLVEPADVHAAMQASAGLLAPGGLLLVAPTYLADEFEPGGVTDIHREDGLRLFSYVYQPPAWTSSYELVMVVLEPDPNGGPMHALTDRHRCGLHALDLWKTAAAEAGLVVHWRPAGESAAWAGLLVGVKPD